MFVVGRTSRKETIEILVKYNQATTAVPTGLLLQRGKWEFKQLGHVFVLCSNVKSLLRASRVCVPRARDEWQQAHVW